MGSSTIDIGYEERAAIRGRRGKDFYLVDDHLGGLGKVISIN
jgi:hypothetical protein